MKKVIIIFMKIVLICSPIIALLYYFCVTFWGIEVELNVNQTNLVSIKEALLKDNIKIDDINNVNKIAISGAGLNDFSYLTFYYKESNQKQYIHLYNNKYYNTEKYLYEKTFNYNDIFNISIFISLLTIIFSLYTKLKSKIKHKNSNFLFMNGGEKYVRKR